MIYTEFISKLKTIPSSFEVYKSQGMSDGLIERIISSYNISERADLPPQKREEDEVVKLVTCYDMTSTQIGMVGFLNNPYIDNDKLFFGRMEVDMLAIYLPLGEIRCYEERSDHVLSLCAKNGDKFLDALFEAGQFLEKRGLDPGLYEDEELGLEVAEYCAELAGGKQYANFYIVLLS